MDFHPIANLFPLMEGAEFEALVADIKANGLLDDIRTFEEKILDGRNRFRACEKAGVSPRFKQWSGTDPYAFVTSKNLRRRDLNPGARALIAEAIATMKAGGDRSKTSRDVLKSSSIDAAAKLMGVSTSSVDRVRVVVNSGDEALIADVRSGKVPVFTAAKRVRIARIKKPMSVRDYHKPPHEGMRIARAAAGKLNEIRNDDLEKDQAYAFIRSWLDVHES